MDDSSFATDAARAASDPAFNSYASTIEDMRRRTMELEKSTDSFSRTMSRAFVGGVTQGKAFDDVLKSMALRMSDLALRQALTPITAGLGGGISSLLSGLFGSAKPFASGGVINTPSYFPMSGGLGLAGEAGPEAILPLARGADGRLGVATGGGAATNVTIHIATPDADSFRRSEAYVTGQIARAVARGQRSL